MKINRHYHIGVIGTGFIARGLLMALTDHPQFVVSGVLTRRDIKSIGEFPLQPKKLTHDIDQLIRTSDLVVECTGDAIHGTDMAEAVLKAGLPVVTMNPELQLTSGASLAKMGTFIEAEGDQPGTLAALDLEVKGMGFTPLVYGNIKRFLNLYPTLADMEYWSKKQGITLPQVTAFTDGTKVQIEQALVANGLGADILKPELTGIKADNHEDGAKKLGGMADQESQVISDYVLSPTAPAGVFIVSKHARGQAPYLDYLKLGKGPYYVITKPYHLCHLEIIKTIFRVLHGDLSYSFNNSLAPTIQVVAVAKRDITSGVTIERALGSFDFRGIAVRIREQPQAVPITLLNNAKIMRPIQGGDMMSFSDVMLPVTSALKFWSQTIAEITSDDLIVANGVHKPKIQADEEDATSWLKFPPLKLPQVLRRLNL